MKEKFGIYERYYDSKSIIKFEKVDENTFIEIYITVKNGIIFLEKYINNILIEKTNLKEVN